MKSALLIASTRAYADPREILRLQDTALVLLTRGWTVDLLIPRSSRLLVVSMPRAVRVLTVPRVPFMDNPPNGPSIRRFATGILMFLRGVALASRRSYSVIHGVNDGAIIARAIDRGTVKRLPYVAEIHEAFSARNLHHGLRAAIAKHLERSALRHSGAIIMPSEEVLDTFDGKIPKSRISFIPDPHTELTPDTFTKAEFATALDHLYAYVLR